MLPTNVLYYGQEQPLPERLPLRAGPLTLFYENGDLRYIKYGEVEIIRRIYAAVRDRNWGTVPPHFSDVQINTQPDNFRITYTVENRQKDIDFIWYGEITGDAQGRIRFDFDGAARSTFMRNRIGFCVLHPANCAGVAAQVYHVDGQKERGVFPQFIVAEQPVQPFAEMEGLAHEVEPDLWAEVQLSGEVFEMEDQRNWTDASFKTFCTPLRLPFPVEIQAGTRIRQTVTLTLRDERKRAETASAAGAAATSALSFRVDSGERPTHLPEIGLGSASHGRRLSTLEIERLKALRLSHLRVDLPLTETGWRVTFEQAVVEAQALGVKLEVALLLTEAAEPELSALRELLDTLRPPIGAWLVFPAREIFKGGSPTAQVVALAQSQLRSYDPSLPWGAGTNTDLIFLQRTPPPYPALDFATFAITAEAHAGDLASVVETLEAQAAAVATARHLAGGLPVAVSPVTFRMRHNPYATGPMPGTPPGQLPSQVQVRQMSLFGAGWTTGSVKYLAESGASRVTYFETTGWRGIMETEAGSLLPELFRSLPGGVFPMYHVFADLSEFAGGAVPVSRSSDPMRVDGLALRHDGRQRVLLANLTETKQIVTVTGLAPHVELKILDETNVLSAMQTPERFRAEAGKPTNTAAGSLELSLLPFAIARLDGVLP